jgi:hypothetical protein
MANKEKKRASDLDFTTENTPAEHHPRLASIGIESEFSLFLNDKQVKPEDVFGDPSAFVRGTMMHRKGTSYHMPTGGAVYFDTGVIEVATPIIEIERGCAARAGRSLWKSILFIRIELDDWEKRTGNRARLVGFSSHYNVSFDLKSSQQGESRTVEKLALLLSYILPVPVMILATNRRSTGVGVRPRGNRIEITVDFTPDPALMIATSTLITGIVRKVITWPSFELEMLDKKQIPSIRGFEPMPHTTRKGWLARFDCYPEKPFAQDINRYLWKIREGYTERVGEQMLPLREIARRIFSHFWQPIARISDPFTFRLINSVMAARAPSLLDLTDRPSSYEDVGRLCKWENLFPEKMMSQSRYERVLLNAISGQKLRIYGRTYTPIGMRGWTQVIFQSERDDTKHIFSIDYLLRHLNDWEQS